MIAAYTTTRNARKVTGVFLFLLLMTLISLMAMIIKFQTDHGRRKYESEPDLAERCLNTHGAA